MSSSSKGKIKFITCINLSLYYRHKFFEANNLFSSIRSERELRNFNLSDVKGQRKL